MENETLIIDYASISRIEKKLESLRAKSKGIIGCLVNMFGKGEKKLTIYKIIHLSLYSGD